VTGEADTAQVAALIADPTRARMLDALFDGGEHAAGALARAAGVAPSTASAHVSRLEAGGLVVVERRGRERRVRLAGSEVAHALEALSTLARARPERSLRAADRGRALRAARTCYDHLAGALGVALTEALCRRGVLRSSDLALTESGATELEAFGIDLDPLGRGARPLTRACMDWSERRHHVAGALGAALCVELFTRGWIERLPEPRAVRVTPAGAQGLAATFGLPPSPLPGR
jgi:DNA-binding transcriptional ArsR family regulator